jgi:Spy/CpxP family protein refolding chaperone
MKIMKTAAIAVAIALGVAASTLHVDAESGVACAGPGPGMLGPPMGPPPMGGGPAEPEPGLQFGLLLRGLGLSTDQQTQVRTILESHRPKLQSLFGQLRSSNDAMRDRLLSTGAIQAGDFDADVKAVTGLREQLMREGLAVALELRQVLTADQLAKASAVSQRLKELQSEMRALLGDPGTMPPP